MTEKEAKEKAAAMRREVEAALAKRDKIVKAINRVRPTPKRSK